MISVIVPIFRGQKYLNRLIRQIESNAEKLAGNQVELLFVNDCPDELIEAKDSNLISIKVFNTDINRGIQGARVRGYELSKGEYLVFLDQDDYIADEYLINQYQNLTVSGADVSVCRAKENGKQVYNNTNPFENVCCLSYMVDNGNPIVSPGQVLLKKEAVSEKWKTNILEHNGADDWLLWLCMLGEHKKFALNSSILYEHVVNGSNTSWDSENMILSEQDVLKVIKSEKVFGPDILKKLEKTIEKEQFRHIHLLEKYREMFFIYDKWMSLENKYGNLADYLFHSGYSNIAVYGMGYIGNQLIKKVMKAGINVVCAIDINADYIESDIPLVSFDGFREAVDLIILTTLLPKQVLYDIKTKTDIKIVTIQQLIHDWSNAYEQIKYCYDNR